MHAMDEIQISAVICTYNRSVYLKRTVASLISQDLDKRKYEIIVVDNNSTDDTLRVVESYKNEADNLRYIHEPTQGLSVARNRGALEAKGEYIAYIDDDAIAGSSWLSRLLFYFQNLDPAPYCIGGKVYLDWEGEPPVWFPSQFLSLYTYLDHGENVIQLNRSETCLYLQGANMAFRRDILMQGNKGFLTHIGRMGSSLLSGEETEMINRLLASDFPVYYAPDIPVNHLVLPERRTRRYLIKRLIADGFTQSIMDMKDGRLAEQQMFGRAFYDVRCFMVSICKAGAKLIIGKQKEAFLDVCTSARRWGRARIEISMALGRKCAG